MHVDIYAYTYTVQDEYSIPGTNTELPVHSMRTIRYWSTGSTPVQLHLFGNTVDHRQSVRLNYGASVQCTGAYGSTVLLTVHSTNAYSHTPNPNKHESKINLLLHNRFSR